MFAKRLGLRVTALNAGRTNYCSSNILRAFAVKSINSDAAFVAALKGAKPAGIVIDWTATWCGPCKRIAPVYDALSSEHSDIDFLKVDVDECQDSARQAGVSSMPTFMFVKGGELVSQFSGADETQLRAGIASLKAAPAPKSDK